MSHFPRAYTMHFALFYHGPWGQDWRSCYSNLPYIPTEFLCACPACYERCVKISNHEPWFRLFLTEDLPCSASCTWSTSSEGSSYAESACHKRNSVDNTGRALATRGPGSSAIPVTTHASGAHNWLPNHHFPQRGLEGFGQTAELGQREYEVRRRHLSGQWAGHRLEKDTEASSEGH